MTGAEVNVFHRRMCKGILRLMKAPPNADAPFIWGCEHGHQFTMKFVSAAYNKNALQSVLVEPEPEPTNVPDPDPR